MSDWINKRDQLPPHGMVLCADRSAREARYWCFVGWRADSDDTVITPWRMTQPYTHWMPLPTPPDAE